MSIKAITLTLVPTFALIAFAAHYTSDECTSERNFVQMINSGSSDLQVIESFMHHHKKKDSLLYIKALQLAARHNKRYLEKVIDYYTTGRLILKTDTAKLIIDSLPSDSININLAAGNIYATNEFQLYNPSRAVKHLEFSARRGDKNAAASLATLYAAARCHIEAITWARVANQRDSSSECSRLPVDINILSDDELDATIDNERELSLAEKENRLPQLRYSADCSIRTNQ